MGLVEDVQAAARHLVNSACPLCNEYHRYEAHVKQDMMADALLIVFRDDKGNRSYTTMMPMRELHLSASSSSMARVLGETLRAAVSKLCPHNAATPEQKVCPKCKCNLWSLSTAPQIDGMEELYKRKLEEERKQSALAHQGLRSWSAPVAFPEAYLGRYGGIGVISRMRVGNLYRLTCEQCGYQPDLLVAFNYTADSIFEEGSEE